MPHRPLASPPPILFWVKSLGFRGIFRHLERPGRASSLCCCLLAKFCLEYSPSSLTCLRPSGQGMGVLEDSDSLSSWERPVVCWDFILNILMGLPVQSLGVSFTFWTLLSFFVYLLWGRVSDCSPGWPTTHHVAEVDFELIRMPLP